MFEKEAEEYKDNTRIKDKNTYIGFPDERISEVQDFEGNYIDISERIIKSFKDGAEFGYNKANEWHYVKDELPPVKKEYCGRSELVLVVSKEKEMQYAQYVEKEKTWARGILAIGFEPYAWKEIVLPKESK